MLVSSPLDAFPLDASPPSLAGTGPGASGRAPTWVRSWTMQRLPTSTGPASDSMRARGWTRLSVRRVMRCTPDRMADSAMIMEEEKRTGALGPASLRGGRMEWRLFAVEVEEDMVAFEWVVGCVVREEGVAFVCLFMPLSTASKLGL